MLWLLQLESVKIKLTRFVTFVESMLFLAKGGINISLFVKRAYKAYFQVPLGDQEKN